MAQVRAQQDYRISAVLKEIFSFVLLFICRLPSTEQYGYAGNEIHGTLGVFEALDFLNSGGLSAGQIFFKTCSGGGLFELTKSDKGRRLSDSCCSRTCCLIIFVFFSFLFLL